MRNGSPNKVLHLPQGLIGFPSLKNWLIVDYEDDNLFFWLESCDQPDVACPLILIEGNPCLVTVPDDPTFMTANTKAPVMFDMNTLIGSQVVLSGPHHENKEIRLAIFQDLKSGKLTKNSQFAAMSFITKRKPNG